MYLTMYHIFILSSYHLSFYDIQNKKTKNIVSNRFFWEVRLGRPLTFYFLCLCFWWEFRGNAFLIQFLKIRRKKNRAMPSLHEA